MEKNNIYQTMKLKVDNGYLYVHIHHETVSNLCFVPDDVNNLETFGRSITNAFREGYECGKISTLEAFRAQSYFVEQPIDRNFPDELKIKD